MKNIFKVSQRDEMQKMISYRAQSYAYYFLFAALFLWTIYESCEVFWFEGELNLLPCFLMVGASMIQGFSELVMQRNAVKGDDEYQSTQPLFRIILFACVIAAVINIAASVIMLLVVRL